MIDWVSFGCGGACGRFLCFAGGRGVWVERVRKVNADLLGGGEEGSGEGDDGSEDDMGASSSASEVGGREEDGGGLVEVRRRRLVGWEVGALRE